MKQINFLALSSASIILLTLCSCRETEETFSNKPENRILKKELKRGATAIEKDSVIVMQSTGNNGEEDPKNIPIKPQK